MGNILMIPGTEVLVSSAIETSCLLAFLRGDTQNSPNVTATKRPRSTSQPERFVVPRNEVRELTKQLAKKIRTVMKDVIANSAKNPPYRIEILKSCEAISLILPEMFTKTAKIEERQHEFDFSPEVHGNGFRSFIHVTDMCLLNISKTLFKIKCERRYATFKGGLYSRELDVLVKALGSLSASIEHLEGVLEAIKTGNLFLDADLSSVTLDAMDRVDQQPFYGRLAGFQFCPSMHRPLQVVTIAMAAFSEGYVSTSRTTVGRLATSLLSAGSYLVDPESRAKRIVQVTRSADIRFCKAFWSLSDKPISQKQFSAISFPQDTASLQRPADCAVNRVVWLNTMAHYLVTTRDGGQTEVTGPAAEPHSLPVRVISYYRRNGMFEVHDDSLLKRSKRLVFHCHGGGFVAQSSKTHECHLLNWAKELDAIIVSVDYSLSPEHPYPRPVEEVVFAYSWVLNHAKHLRWTGERLVACGDSAGALIVVCSMLKLSSLNVQRLPDAIVPIYGSFLVEYCISPSRFLSQVDPLLPIGILVRCIAAYTGHSESELKVRSPRRRGGSVARFYLDSKITKESEDDAEVLGKTEEYVAEIQRSRATPGRTHSLSSLGRTPESIDLQPPITCNGSTLELVIPPQMWELRDYYQKWRRNEEKEEKRSSSSAPSSPKKLRHSAHFRLANRSLTSQDLEHEIYGYVKSFKPNRRSELAKQFSTLHTIDEEGPSSYKPSILTQTPLQPFQRMEIPKTPFLSPYYATDDELAKLPPFRIIACHLDSLLDDSVVFAKRLRNAGNDVTLHLVPDIPHAFLNLTHVSGDCHMAAKRCMTIIDHALTL